MTEPDKSEQEAQPERARVKCDTCGALVDPEDVTKVRGKFYCDRCLDASSALESILPFREKYDVRWIRWTVLGCGVLLILAVFGVTFMLVFTYMRLDTAMTCKNLHLMPLYRTLLLYAQEHNAYPPANNDLRPLYHKGYTTNFRLFVCPGTKNIVTTIRHLKDDSAAPEGEGMSYFYQGGHGFIQEEGAANLPLLWDQSPANHRDRGVNVLFKDGHHDFWSKRIPELRPPEALHAEPAPH